MVTSNGQISCLKTATGEVVWSHPFSKWEGRMQNGWGYSESPLVDGRSGAVYSGGENAMVVALNKKTGDEVWKCGIPELGDKGKDGAAYSSIMISNGGA